MSLSQTGLIVYGLLRSAQMTYVAYASLQEYVMRNLVWNANNIVFSVDGTSNWLPKSFRVHNKSRVLVDDRLQAGAAYVRAMSHVLYGLDILAHCTIVVVSRVDVEYASYLTIPNVISHDTIKIPNFQNHGGLNDRFCIGERRTLLRWFQHRSKLAQKHVYSEKGACRAAKELKLNVLSTDINFVRRRSNLFVPDIDKATVWKSIPVRPWMRLHQRSCLNASARHTLKTWS